jgi:diadenosine tetraphosphate (Ap4A) HIT family hydrolase/5-methylcytosine-specific restriction endonuclease McrA
MTYEQLVEFLQHRMSMSHIYQPLLIRCLIDAGGAATIRQLAQSFVCQDESQLRYYEQRIKEMPVRVLSRHGVIERDGQLVTLSVPQLSFVQRAHLRMLCEQRLQEYLQRRGLAVWDYRLLDDPVPDSLRYLALKAGGGRCALCGATKEMGPLDVDHIIPRSRGGRTELANLQVLCAKCNRSKRNQDQTDFRMPSDAQPSEGCPFCGPSVLGRAIEEYRSVFAIADLYPVTDGHHLVVPKRHRIDYFAMTVHERSDADDLLRYLRNKLADADPAISGFNVGANAGEAAGQTVMHAHIHLIPRRSGDNPEPRGGVRAVIPGKVSY